MAARGIATTPALAAARDARALLADFVATARCHLTPAMSDEAILFVLARHGYGAFELHRLYPLLERADG
jgi:hypothetical protein